MEVCLCILTLLPYSPVGTKKLEMIRGKGEQTRRVASGLTGANAGFTPKR